MYLRYHQYCAQVFEELPSSIVQALFDQAAYDKSD